MKNEIRKVKEFIRENKIDEALTQLKEIISNPFEHELILLNSRYAEIKKKSIIGINNKEEDLQLQYDILRLLEQIEKLDHLAKINLSTREKVLKNTERNDLINILLKKLSESVQILNPKNEEEIVERVITMRGTISIDLPAEEYLWVLQKNNSFYYHTDRSIEVDYSSNIWEQENLNFGVNGVWELIICLVKPKSHQMLLEKINRNDWYGFKKIPKGINKIKSIRINKR